MFLRAQPRLSLVLKKYFFKKHFKIHIISNQDVFAIVFTIKNEKILKSFGFIRFHGLKTDNSNERMKVFAPIM